MRSNFPLIQKRPADAEMYALEAHRIDPDNVQVLIALSQILSNASDIDGAIKLLERAHRINPLAGVEFMYARALLRRGEAQDLDLGIAVLSALELESLPAPMKSVVATLAVQGTLRKGDPASAAAYLERASGELEATVQDSLRGYIAHTEGDRSKALEFAKCAESEISSATAPETKEFLARLFMMADHPEQALPLYLELFDLASSSTRQQSRSQIAAAC
jgi:tetratricopeptide (TPR) repeat protein